MTIPDLIPLAEAARRLGVTSKTLRNRAARARAGLPGWNLPITKLGERCYVASEDLDLFLAGLKHENDDDDPRLELQRLADQVGRVFPEVAERLRQLSAVIPCSPRKQRKRKPRTTLRRVDSGVGHQSGKEVQP